MKKIIYYPILLIACLYAVTASTVQELSDDFEDGNYSHNPKWDSQHGVWDIPVFTSKVLRPLQGAITNSLRNGYQLNSSYNYRNHFGMYEFKLEYDLSLYNKTNFVGGDTFSVNIGENSTSLGRYVYQGYQLGIGIGGVSEVQNQCYIYFAERNGDSEPILYYNLTWFNKTNTPCQSSPLHVIFKRESSGIMSVQINNKTAYNRSQLDFQSYRWNTVTVYASFNHATGHMKAWVDNIKVYNTTLECVEDWLAQYNNQSCNGTFINEIKTYLDNNNCGTYSNLPGDNNTISNTYNCATPPTGNVVADIDKVNNNYLALGITLFLAIWVIVALFGGNIKEAKPLIIAIIVLILIIGCIMYFLDLWGRTF